MKLKEELKEEIKLINQKINEKKESDSIMITSEIATIFEEEIMKKMYGNKEESYERLYKLVNESLIIDDTEKKEWEKSIGGRSL